MTPAKRSLEDLLADLREAADAAAELVALGKERWDRERPLRLAGEAVVGRIGDIATKLPDFLVRATSELPWAEIKGMRIVVDHAYHSIDYDRVWQTLREDVPVLKSTIDRWIEREKHLGLDRFWDKGRSPGPDVGLGL